MTGTSSRLRGGFTLVEIMFVLLISCTVMVAVGTLFIGSHRLIKQSYGVARASLDLRAEREHLLFHSNHEGGNAYWGGLLSASKREGLSSDRIRYTATGIDMGSGFAMSRSGQSYPNDLARTVDKIAFASTGDALYSIMLTRVVPNTDVTLSDCVIVSAFGVAQPIGWTVTITNDIERAFSEEEDE